jgi:hypothetical protein
MLALPLALVACQSDASDVSPGDARQGELASMQGAMIEIVPGEEMSQEELEAVAKWLEAQSAAHMVKVGMRKSEAGEERMEIEIWGETELPESLDADLRAAFPALANAEITQARLDGPPPGGPGPHGPSHEAVVDEDPEAAKARIIEEMRARGVEGDIAVDVVDGPDGERRVEVKVEKSEHSPE